MHVGATPFQCGGVFVSLRRMHHVVLRPPGQVYMPSPHPQPPRYVDATKNLNHYVIRACARQTVTEQKKLIVSVLCLFNNSSFTKINFLHEIFLVLRMIIVAFFILQRIKHQQVQDRAKYYSLLKKTNKRINRTNAIMIIMILDKGGCHSESS